MEAADETPEEAEETAEETDAHTIAQELEVTKPSPRRSRVSISQASPIDSKGRKSSIYHRRLLIIIGRIFKRAEVPKPTTNGIPPSLATNGDGFLSSPPAAPALVRCPACNSLHQEGYCPLKLAGPEHCPLCGLAHYGFARTCPHINSVTQLRMMNETLKHSTEDPALKELAKKKILGIIGDLNQRKRRAEEAMKEKHAAEDAVFANGAGLPPVNGISDYGRSVQPNGLDGVQENRTPRHFQHLFS